MDRAEHCQKLFGWRCDLRHFWGKLRQEKNVIFGHFLAVAVQISLTLNTVTVIANFVVQ